KLIIQAGGEVSAGTLAYSEGNGGNLTINASDSVAVSGESVDGEVNSRLTTRTEGGGDAGNLIITTGKLIIQAGGEVSAGTLAYSEGNGGNLTINASDSVEVSGKSVNGGANSRLTVRTGNSKNAGGMTINTGKLIIQAGGEVSAGTRGGSEGSGGSLIVNASNSVDVNGLSADSQNSSRLTTRTEGGGNAGALTINTKKLIIQAGGQVSASTMFGSTGAAGSLTVNASDSVEVMGFTAKPEDTILSRLTTRTEGGGNADNLTINTKKLIIRDGGQVSAGTVLNSTGNGGNLTVNASESVEVSKEVVGIPGGSVKSRLTNRTENNRTTGNLRITTGKLIVQDQAEVGVNSNLGFGKPGNLEVVARSILLDNQATLNARAASVDGGNIILQVQDILLLRRNSNISATAGIAGAGGNGGNITINIHNGFIVAVPNENSDITANAYTGSGGRVDIQAFGIYGIQPRPNQTSLSDITASSEFGVNGTVELNTPDIDPNSGLVNLSTIPVDTQVAQTCQADGNLAKISFTITGRGGLPPNPSEALNADAVQVDLVTLNPSNDRRDRTFVPSKITTTTPEPIIEATGLALNEKGQVVLTANLPTTTPHSPWLKPASCKAIPNS
ncbi:MAG: S-layer family protein, partial [Nostoc sp.]